MTLFTLILITHIAVAVASVSSVSMSFFVSQQASKMQAVLWSSFTLTIVSGVGLYLMVPSTLGRTCAMMAVLTPLAILAHKNLQSKLLQNS